MLDSISKLKDIFKPKYLKQVHGPHRVDERADLEPFKAKVKERLIKAVIRGVVGLPLVSDKKPEFEAEIAYRHNGYYIKHIQFLRRSVYARSVFWQIVKEFPISYTDEAAAVMDAFYQEVKLQDFVEKICIGLVKNLQLESLGDIEQARLHLNNLIANRLAIELDDFFNANQLLVLCCARAEGVKGSLIFKDDEDGKIQGILDRRNYDRPMFDDQYHLARGKYKPVSEKEDEEKPFE